MMKQLYQTQDVQKYNNLLKKYCAIAILLILLAGLTGIIICFFVDDDNANVLKWINIVWSSLCLCTAIYVFLNEIQPLRARKNFAARILCSNGKRLRGRVSDCGRTITSERYITLQEICLIDENGKEHVLFWDLEKGKADFKDHIVEFYVVNNKIAGFGEAE